MSPKDNPANAIAIVGMAGHFPAARDVAQFWKLLSEGREAITWLSDAELAAAGVPESDLSNPAYVKAALILDDLETFDAAFFGFSPREAAIMDPQHRHFLECCWEALEDAGHRPSAFAGAIGVFGGCGPQSYHARHLLPNRDLVASVGHFLLRHTGNDKDFLTTRVSYLLDLKGPSVGVQTACSTSLVAVHAACQSLLSGECDMALAGGASIELPHRTGYVAAAGEILSPTGHCAAFDDAAAGTVFGSGAGVVVLRRLEDAIAGGDNIQAVILGSAINNDGAGKAGYFAPSVDGQARAAAEAVAVAEVPPSTIDYIEAHGTGTVIGDPIELAALEQVYAPGTETGRIGIGSVKTNIGHLDTAAGVASLIKVVQALKHETLPASLNYNSPNQRYDFARGPFSVVAAARGWPRRSTPRRAAVNSLGVGGTNAHVVVEEAPAVPAVADSGTWQVVTLSAKSEASLAALTAKWRAFAAAGCFSLDDAAYTSQVGREPFTHRLAVVARTPAELATALAATASPHVQRGKADGRAPGVVFMFPGGGAQYPAAARDLYRADAVFRATADQCLALVPPAAADLADLMFGPGADRPDAGQRLEHPLLSILAVFIVEIALARMWQSHGVTPVAVVGNSAGDYAAAVVAGVMSLEDAIGIVALRGKIFADMPPGAMLAVQLSEARLRKYLAADLDVAVASAPELTVVSGSVGAIEDLQIRLERDGVECSRVRIGVAAHSRMLDVFLPSLREHLRRLRLQRPTLPFMSCLTGTWADPAEVATPGYWIRHLRETVRFGAAIERLLDEPDRILLEVGPGKSLGPLVAMAKAKHAPRAVFASTRAAIESGDDIAVVRAVAGGLWAYGVSIDFAALRGAAARRRISVPTYAFDRERHWIDAPSPAVATPVAAVTVAPREPAGMVAIRRLHTAAQWLQKPVFRARALPQSSTMPRLSGATLVFSDGSDLAGAIADRLRREGDRLVVVEAAEHLRLDASGNLAVDPAEETHYARLFAALAEQGAAPARLVHLWSLAAADAVRSRTLGFDSLFLALRELQRLDTDVPVDVTVVTRGAVALHGQPLQPLNAMPAAAVRVWCRETPGAGGRLIDIGPADAATADIAGRILAEIAAASNEPLVALRGGARFVQRYEAVPAAAASENRIKAGGVYLVTGGTGALGLRLARHLVTSCGAHPVVVGRTAREAALPPDLTGRVTVAAADVTDSAAMARVIERIRSARGRLDGVIHAAGAIDDAPIAAKSLADVHRVFAAKVDGARVLDRLLPVGSIDLFAVFSSTSAIAGPPGQIDYAAANAFLDALAASRRDGLSINWGIWGDAGMAVRGKPGSADHQPAVGVWPGTLRRAGAGIHVFDADLEEASFWPLGEHTVAATPVLPGTAYLDAAYAALRAVGASDHVALEAVTFVQPFTAPPGHVRRLTTEVRALGLDQWRIEISSRSGPGADADVHFQCDAKVSDEVASLPPPAKGGAALTGDLVVQRGPLALGRRWSNIEAVRRAGDAVHANLALAPEFELDRLRHPLHPALLDIAMTIGLHTVPAEERTRALFVPAAIGRVDIIAPLPSRIVAQARRTKVVGGVVYFDVTLTTVAGAPVVEIRDLAMRPVDAAAFTQADGRIFIDRQAPVAGLLAAGFTVKDADAAFAAAFSATNARLVVTSVSLGDLERIYALPSAPERSRPSAAQAAIDLTPTERMVADMFADLLGATDIGLDDAFLDRGGHSLAAVRLFARIRKKTGLDLGIATLFEAPSVRSLAALIDQRLGAGVAEAPSGAAAANATAARAQRRITGTLSVHRSARAAAPSRWTPLVRISQGPPGARPLFWIHGAAGNVVSISPLADHLRTRHPIYALQAHGVDGRMPPMEKIEDMAASYVAAIREADPHGPYCLLGYSGGGVIAYEMAQQLTASGYEVALLAMIDTLAPTSSGGARITDWIRYGWHWGPSALIYQVRTAARMHIGNTMKRWFPPASDGREIDPIMANADRVFASYLRAQSRYFTMPYGGNILLFRAKRAGVGFYAAGRTLGWGTHVGGRVDVHEIDANHDSIVLKPGIDRVAEVIDRRLNDVDEAQAVHAGERGDAAVTAA